MAEAAVWPYGLGIAVFIVIAVVTMALRKKRKRLWYLFSIYCPNCRFFSDYEISI